MLVIRYKPKKRHRDFIYVRYNLEGMLKACGWTIDQVKFVEVKGNMIAIHCKNGDYINHILTMSHVNEPYHQIPQDMILFGYSDIKLKFTKEEIKSLDVFFDGFKLGLVAWFLDKRWEHIF